MARLARREKARFWTGLLSDESPVVNFMTQCIRELFDEPLDPGATPGALPQRELHAGNRTVILTPLT